MDRKPSIECWACVNVSNLYCVHGFEDTGRFKGRISYALNVLRAVGSKYFVATDFNPLFEGMYFLSAVGTAHFILKAYLKIQLSRDFVSTDDWIFSSIGTL